MTNSRTPPAAPAATVSDQRVLLLRHYQEFEQNFLKNHFALWLGTLIGPWLVTFLLIGVIWGVCGPEYTRSLLIAGTISFTVAGRFVIPLEDIGDWGKLLTPEQVFWLVTYQDVAVALFMAFHVGFLFKLPKIGPKIAELIVDGEMILSLQPWMKQLTFWGLVAFVAFPLSSTGSVGGAIFGRLLGLSRWATFCGSVLGAVIGNAAMLYGSKVVKSYLPADNFFVRWGGLVVILLIVALLERRYSAMKRQFLQDRAAAEPLSLPPQGESSQ
uniref:Small multi-drug export protein n=1 Tax=Schlesneria paludicola TaxID=360056 RepID=A0A7C4LMN5_9PLAN